MSSKTDPDAVPVLSAYSKWKYWEAANFGRFSIQENAYYEAEFGPLLRNCSKPALLEIGFGNGAFLGWSLSRGYECCGIEVIPELVDRAHRLGLKTYGAVDEPSLRLRRGQFDCVVAFDVLEHIDQAQMPAYFQTIAGLLKAGGHFVARFPNGDSPFGRVYQHGDLTHVTTLGQFKIRQLAAMAALDVVTIGQAAPFTAGPGMMERLQLTVGRGMRAAIERVFSTLYFGGMRVAFSPNLVIVLRKRG